MNDRSAMEEWAQRELARQDREREWAWEEMLARQKRDREFRERHPWLARLLYGKDRSGQAG